MTVDVAPAPSPAQGRCRAWPLVARPGRLTEAERAAGDLHLTLCRRCRTALDDAARARRAATVGAGTLGAVAMTTTGAVSATGTTAVTAATAGTAAAAHGVLGLVLGGALAAVTATGVASVATRPDHASTRPPASSPAPRATAPARPHATPGRFGAGVSGPAQTPTTERAGQISGTTSGTTTARPAPTPTPTDLRLPAGPTAVMPTLAPSVPLPTGSAPLPSPAAGDVVGTVTDILPSPTLGPALP